MRRLEICFNLPISIFEGGHNMSDLLFLQLGVTGLGPALQETEAQILAVELGDLSNLSVYPRSIAATQNTLFFLGRRGINKFLGILSEDGAQNGAFTGERQSVSVAGKSLTLTLAPTSAANAVALRRVLPFLVARPWGLRKSAGCGDRLGLATPGHLRSIRKSTMAPILAQQSIRENARTGRSPQEVMDDVLWGVLQEGWRDGFGADADHLKTTTDIDICVAAGYTFYTIDPGEYVDNSANKAALGELQQKVEALPWNVLDSSPSDLQSRLADKPVDLGDFSLTISQEELLRAAAKYGRAVAHTVAMYRHLVEVMGERPFELEMSVDETETVTSLAEHVYIVSELKRLNVRWVSLAPRYVGEFEKGADYKGDLAEFERSFARHLAVSKTFGPYKLSLHSGSDKFSIYPIASRVAGELVHLKTAGTSYLEALRAIAILNPTLFREIVAFALERYPTDRATYHVSAEVAKVPNVSALPDDQLTSLLDDFHGREVLHVTFGSVLHHPTFREPFFATLRSDEETYYQALEAHFDKHFNLFE
jgi:hypothetical protein